MDSQATSVGIKRWIKNTFQDNDDPENFPDRTLLLRRSLDTSRTFQRCHTWLMDATLELTRTKLRKRTAEYKLELYYPDNTPKKFERPLAETETSLLKPYKYSPFEKDDTIRLLVLYPGLPKETVRCALSVYNLGDLPSYEALSYSWGHGPQYPIICEGQTISVQENLLSALYRLRDPASARVLWIDALCINQSDISERSSQVQYMRSIYQKARSVVVWLGEESATSPMGFELLRDLVSLAESESNSDVEPMQSEDLKDRGLPERSSPKWRALGAIFWRGWFTRIWIIQEVSLAKSATVVCGTDACSWAEMVTTARFILSRSLDTLTDVDPRLVIKLSDFTEQDNSNRRLLPLLSKARSSFATDQRDKVIGIRGLATDIYSLTLVPDYSLSVSELYTGLAKCIIQRDGNLDILNAVEDHRYRIQPGIPSWVPDWEVHDPSSPLSSHRDFLLMRAAGESKPSCVFQHDDKCLVARGVTIDSIDYIGDTFREFIPVAGGLHQSSTYDDSMARTRVRQWERLAYNLKTYPTGEDIREAFVRTLIGQVKLEAEMSSKELPLYYDAWRRYWTIVQQQHGRFIDFLHKELSVADLARATYIMKGQQETAYGRRFFTTKNGYMGLCPSLGRIGDKVVILLGGRTPYILQKNDKKGHRFVGGCYVHGMMTGEGLNGSSNIQGFQIW